MDRKNALKRSVIDTFESMAFQELTPVPVNPLPAPALWSFRQGSMSICAPFQGILVMTISAELLHSVTASAYGIDPKAVEASMEYDTLAEMLNTMAGLWMRNITKSDQFFKLGLQEADEVDYISGETAETHCVFDADGDFIEVAFFPV